MTFKWREDPRRGAATQETSEKKPGKKFSFDGIQTRISHTSEKDCKRSEEKSIPRSTNEYQDNERER